MTASIIPPKPASPDDRIASAQPARTRPARHTIRRLARTALFAAVRGLAYTAGTATFTVIIWWITHH
jgi:hypothetical protein